MPAPSTFVIAFDRAEKSSLNISNISVDSEVNKQLVAALYAEYETEFDFLEKVVEISTDEKVGVRDVGESIAEQSDCELSPAAGVVVNLLSTEEPDSEESNIASNEAPDPLAQKSIEKTLDALGKKFDDGIHVLVEALKNPTNAPKSEVPIQTETAHNPTMTEVTRELLDAKLDSVRAEVRASIAESSKETVAAMGQLNTQMATMQGQMLTEMQGLRADFANMLKDVTKEMAATNVNVAQLGEKVSGVGGKVEGLEGKVDGLKSSVSMLQTVIGYGIGVAGVIVAIGAIAVAWMQLDFAKKTTTTSAPVAATAQASNERVAPSAPSEQKKTGG